MSRLAGRGLVLLIVGAGLWFALRGISGTEILQSLARTRVPFVAIGGLSLLAVGIVARTGRYGALLPRSDWHAGAFELWPAVVLSTAGNNVMPLRAGELLRTRETVAAGYSLAQVAIAQVAEKVIEAATIAAYAAPVIVLRLRGQTAVVLGALSLTGLALAGWMARRFRIAPRQLAASLAWSAAADAVEIGIIAVCLHGVGLAPGFVPSVAVFVGVNLAIALPSTPGNLGTFEAGAALPLLALGVEHEAAVAFACVYRVVQWLPVTLAGAVVWAKRTRISSARPSRHLPPAPSADARAS